MLQLLSPSMSVAGFQYLFFLTPTPEVLVYGTFGLREPFIQALDLVGFGVLWTILVLGLILAIRGVGRDPAAAPSETSTKTNGLALASIIVVWFSSLVSLILGHIALSQIKTSGEQGRRRDPGTSVGWEPAYT